MRHSRKWAMLGSVVGLLIATTNISWAQSVFNVHLDTSSLVGNINGPFSLDFQLSDGSGTNDGNTTVTISNFGYGTGSATGTANLFGGASGNLSSSVTLTDTNFINEFYQSFTPGNTLTFDVSIVSSAEVGPTPDQFSFAILDNTLSEIPTTSSVGGFLTTDIAPGNGSVTQGFAGTGNYNTMSAPVIVSTAAPEPASVAVILPVLAIGALTIGYRRRRVA